MTELKFSEKRWAENYNQNSEILIQISIVGELWRAGTFSNGIQSLLQKELKVKKKTLVISLRTVNDRNGNAERQYKAEEEEKVNIRSRIRSSPLDSEFARP